MTLINPVNIYTATEIHWFLLMRTKSVFKTERTCWQGERWIEVAPAVQEDPR